jgi:hypothetical protein
MSLGSFHCDLLRTKRRVRLLNERHDTRLVDNSVLIAHLRGYLTELTGALQAWLAAHSGTGDDQTRSATRMQLASRMLITSSSP